MNMNITELPKWLKHRFRKYTTKDIYEIFPEMEFQLDFPGGFTHDSLLKFLEGYVLEGANERFRNELKNYLLSDFRRFVYTLNLIPPGQGKVLEIGSQPYFTSILINKFTNYELYCTNYLGGEKGYDTHKMYNPSTHDELTFQYVNCNIEEDVPYHERFDVILFCEVIEHLTRDPMGALLRMKEMLKPQGHLILTTPNVNRLENVAKMLAGANIYDPYSGYGIYGRHNREFNKHELYLMLTHLGFELEMLFSSDVHPNYAENFYNVRKYHKFINFRKNDLGQYIFLRARNDSQARKCKPRWLYQSYPEEELCIDC